MLCSQDLDVGGPASQGEAYRAIEDDDIGVDHRSNVHDGHRHVLDHAGDELSGDDIACVSRLEHLLRRRIMPQLAQGGWPRIRVDGCAGEQGQADT